MVQLLVRLFLIFAALQLGVGVTEVVFCHSQECRGRIEGLSREVLEIDWRPISVFPEEGRYRAPPKQ